MKNVLLWFLCAIVPSASLLAEETLRTELLIVGGDEAGCAAAVQAARLGVKQIVLVNDIDWLGGQFCTQGIGPLDEWTIVDGRRVNFPRSGAFLEIVERIRAHNLATYGIATPGNAWCGTETIEPRAAAKIFQDWLAPYGPEGTGQITIQTGWRPTSVIVDQGRVLAVRFADVQGDKTPLLVESKVTLDSTDWGDVIRLSGADYMAGPDLKSKFHEPSAPETIAADGGHQEMNPISWCPLLREASGPHMIAKPSRYDSRSFADWSKAPPWVDWDGSGGIYNFAGWCIYTHRRMVDRHHHGLPEGTEATILNWPAHDYPLSTLPAHVVEQLERLERGASKKNIVDMSYEQRAVVYEDAKQRSLEFLYWLQTEAHDRVGDFPQSFRYMKLAEDYGTKDRLPPKPYIREGLRLDSLYVTRESDVRTEVERPTWAATMMPDGVFGWQFNMDFHPTRRSFIGQDVSQPWQSKHYGTRNWNAYTDRSMFPLRGLVPVELNGLLGCSKNIGVSSMVQSALRLHGQMMHVGTASGTLAAMAIRDGIEPREIASSPRRVREIQRILVRGASGHGVLIWPWHDVDPQELHFEAANLLTIAGVWRADPDSLYFSPRQPVTRRQLAGALARLCRIVSKPRQWPTLDAKPRFADVPLDDPDRGYIDSLANWVQVETSVERFRPDENATWGTLHEWLGKLGFPRFSSLVVKRPNDDFSERLLLRADCVDYLYRVLLQRGEDFPPDREWLVRGGDHDQDGRDDMQDALPFDRDNDSVPDRLQIP